MTPRPHPAQQRNTHGITVTENQYRVMQEAQRKHDEFCEKIYAVTEEACKRSQENLDELWRRVSSEGYAR